MLFSRLLPTMSKGSSDLLPITSTGSSITRAVHVVATRRKFFVVCCFCISTLLCLSIYSRYSELQVVWADIYTGADTYFKPGTHSVDSAASIAAETEPDDAHPPTYDRFYEIERFYPQHDASLPFPEGKDGRFLWVSNQHFGLGWNNIFQNLYMLAHVAHLSNRAFVFEPYTWSRDPNPYSTYNGHVIPARIPLAALIEGPLAGGPFPQEQPNPRSVSIEFFNQVCPVERRTRLSIKEMNKGLEWRPVNEIVEKYSAKLLGMNDGCVELYGGLEHPFDWMQFGDKSMSTVWPELSKSPILREFKWSSLALLAVRTNAPSFAPELSSNPHPNVVSGLMAIHLRRGDYDVHCQSLANWSSSYMGWAQIPGLGDLFTPPPGGGWGSNTPENMDEYMRHCFPDIPWIMRRVTESRYAWETREGKEASEPQLRRLYIMTNGKREWVQELKQRLLEVGDWDIVFTSRDMELNHEQKYIAQAVDQAIAERATVFIGTGFSSLTANTILLRMMHDLPRNSNHFW